MRALKTFLIGIFLLANLGAAGAQERPFVHREVAKDADVIVVLTEWNEFRALDLKRLRGLMTGNVIVDLRNMYPEALAEEAGFIYYGVGRILPPLAERASNRRRGSAPKSRSVHQVTH